MAAPFPMSSSPPSTSPTSRGTGFSPTTAAFLSQFQVQSNPKSINPSSFNKLSLNTAHDSSGYSAFNPYFLSPSNRCKSPSLTINPAFTFASAAAAYCPSPSMAQHSPRMGVKEANETWDAQWSPFGHHKLSAASPTNGTGPSSKFHWTYEEGGHERDKGDDSTSDEEEDERKEAEPPRKSAAPSAFGFDFDPFPPSTTATTSSLSSSAAKFATPAISPRAFLHGLTPKTRRPAAGTPSISVFPAPSSSFSIFPTMNSPPPCPPNSPPLNPPLASAVDPCDKVATTHAPPKMATAAATAVATAGANPAVLAAAALLKKNTEHNKTIAATSEELFKDLETPRDFRPRGAGERTVGFADEKGQGLTIIHEVEDDWTQYPIPERKKAKGKAKKEKCKVM